ncbi:MAG: PGF-pre-PGF domain-containing protein [Candidatus Methanoperedens sp.]|nr:PGF-pre-PGF domain-containing protein [Candidatus Methanoperedens sp.]
MNKKTTFLIVFFVLVSAGASVALNPPIPAGYYGSVTIDGQPAPPGTTIVAKIGAEERGRITTGSSGSYGNSDGYEKLAVTGHAGESGSTVTFLVNNVAARQTTTWTSGDIKQIDLTSGGATAAGGGGGSGSGTNSTGGGNVISVEPFDNIEFQETREVNLRYGIPVTVNFTLPGQSVYELMITPNVNAGPTSVKIQQLKDTSKLVSSPAPGIVYKNVNIIIGGRGFAVPANITEGIIRFRVNNTWHTGEKGDTVMLRWDGSKWDSLDTTETTTDDNVTYHETRTNTFSSFAITGTGKTVATPAATQPVDNSVVTAAEMPEPAPPVNLVLIIGVILLIAVVIIVVSFLRR